SIYPRKHNKVIKILYHSTFDHSNVFSSLRNQSILSTPPPKSHSINSTLLLSKTTLHFQPNKNKIPQLGQSPKSLENLTISILQLLIFIHPRHQRNQLNMCRHYYVNTIYCPRRLYVNTIR